MTNSDLEEILKEVDSWMEKKRSPFQFFGISKPELDNDPICKNPLFGYMLALKIYEKPNKYKGFKKLWQAHFADKMHAQTLSNISALAFEGLKLGIRLNVIDRKSSIMYSMNAIDKYWTVGGDQFGGSDGLMRRTYVFTSDSSGHLEAQYYYSNISLSAEYGPSKHITFMDKNVPASRNAEDAIMSLIGEYENIYQAFNFLMLDPANQVLTGLLKRDDNKKEYTRYLNANIFDAFVSNLSTPQQKQFMSKLTGDPKFSPDAVRLVFGEDISYFDMLSLDVLKVKSEEPLDKLPEMDISF